MYWYYYLQNLYARFTYIHTISFIISFIHHGNFHLTMSIVWHRKPHLSTWLSHKLGTMKRSWQIYLWCLAMQLHITAAGFASEFQKWGKCKIRWDWYSWKNVLHLLDWKMALLCSQISKINEMIEHLFPVIRSVFYLFFVMYVSLPAKKMIVNDIFLVLVIEWQKLLLSFHTFYVFLCKR